MPQISLYIDQETLLSIEERANKEHVSVSKWVGSNLKRLMNDEYPETYFALFGAVQDDSFVRPVELPHSSDTPRESV
jgi:hypothetical protein